MSDNTDLVVDAHDRASLLWMKLERHLRARLDLLRRKNDAPTLTPEQTASLRGQILEVKALLKDLSAAGESQD
jgi:hypothetical protein